MSITIDRPDSKYQELSKMSSPLNEKPSNFGYSNTMTDSSKESFTENRVTGETTMKTNGKSPNYSKPSTPPPLEPIPASLFPGESAKIYSGMPALISSSSLPDAESSEPMHREYVRSSFDTNMPYNRSPPNKVVHSFHVPSNVPSSGSPLLMPPPINNMQRMRSNGLQESSGKIPENGHSKLRYPDSSHESYSSRPGPSPNHRYHDHSNYPNQSYYKNSNGNNTHHCKNGYDSLGKSGSSLAVGRVHLVNGNVSHPTKNSESVSKSTNEDNNEIINVDEDVDLERMYLDLITEEYTATVKRYVKFAILEHS